MATFFALILGLVLILATITIHYEALRAISGAIPRLRAPPRARILIVIGGVFIAHFAEIALYAFAFAVMQNRFGLGAISGVLEGNPLDFLYLSISSYTTPAQDRGGDRGAERPRADRLVGVFHLSRHAKLLAGAWRAQEEVGTGAKGCACAG
jgi:hypothetical protein